MHRLARPILVVVGVFVLLVVGTLVLRSRAGRTEGEGLATSRADLHIKEVDLEEVVGGLRWRLKADQVLVFDGEGRTTLRRIRVHLEDRDRWWRLEGEEGELDRPTKNLVLRGHVVLTAADGLRLETTEIRWDDTGKRLWTDAAVSLHRKDAVIRGSAFEVRIPEDQTTVTGRVHAQFASARAR